MNCTKCGKEIPEGKELCDDCQKELNQEAKSTKPKKETKKKEDNVKSKKAESKKATKTEKVKKDKKASKDGNDNKSKKELIIACIIIVCVIAAFVAIIIFSITKLNSGNVGNTIGNIRNYGRATIKGNSIYYLGYNEDFSKLGILKASKDGKNPKELYMSDFSQAASLNVKGNYLYFIGIGPNEYSDTDELDNKIYKMKTDGTDLTVINDNEFSNDCFEIYVVKNNVYYVGTDSKIYKMDLNGGNRTLVTEDAIGYIGITDKYIIYNKLESDDAADYVTYISNLDGSNARPIIKDTRLYSVNVEGNEIIYTSSDKHIYKTVIDSNESELLYEVEAYNLNTSGKDAYYINFKDAANGDYKICIFKVGIDEKTETPVIVKEFEDVSQFIAIVGDQILFEDDNETCLYIKLIDKDGDANEKTLYTFDIKSYMENSENATYSDTDESSSTTTDTNNVEPEETNTLTEEEEAAIVANEQATQQ